MDEGACTNKTVTVTVRVSMKPAYLSLVCVWASKVALQVCMLRKYTVTVTVTVLIHHAFVGMGAIMQVANSANAI